VAQPDDPHKLRMQRLQRRRRTLKVIAAAASGSVAVVAAVLWWLSHSIGPPNHGILDPGAPAPRVDPYCGALPATGFDRPPNRAHSGDYVNAVYGYAVTIPDDLIGYTPFPGAQKGFSIVLSWKPRAVLSVDAVYDVFYDITPAGVHLRDVVGVRLYDQLLSDHSQPGSLDGTAGGRFRMSVRCAGDPQTWLHEDVIVVRNREIYRVDLQTVPQRYAQDVRVLDALLHSWRWVPLAHSQ
jgi:hypothetical protein